MTIKLSTVSNKIKIQSKTINNAYANYLRPTYLVKQNLFRKYQLIICTFYLGAVNYIKT